MTGLHREAVPTVAKAKKSRGLRQALIDAERPQLRVTREALARVATGKVMTNHRPTVETLRKLDLLMAAVGVLKFDPKLKAKPSVPDTYEKLYNRAVEQFLDLYDAEPQFKLPQTVGPTAKRRGIWVRGDLMLRIEKIAADCGFPVSRLIDAAIDTYVDYFTRGIDPKTVSTLAGAALKLLDTSEETGVTLLERERKARKVMRTGQA